MNYFRFKICIFGDGGVGKTTLVNRFISGKLHEDFKMTIGVDFYTKMIEVNELMLITTHFIACLSGYLFCESKWRNKK